MFNYGEVAEWSKANDSKPFNRRLFVGSNPTLSVTTSFGYYSYAVISPPTRLQLQDS